MEYFNLLNLKKEPFSNSPAPEFLFASPQYSTCLQMLELAVRLRRGLNIVIGAVGTGKTTLCRKLIQNLSAPTAGDSLEIETYLLLDPALANRLEFVKTVAGIVGINDVHPDDDEWHLKEKFKKFLFEKGVDEQKIIVLIIDEGQKIPDDCLEILREFLNYETNNSKLLQIVIFAQPEIDQSLIARANLLDRVNYLCRLKPLSFGQMKAMIEHRIAVARQEPIHQPLFTPGGLLAVYLATKGYPRRVVSLCHQVVLMMIIRSKDKAGWFLVRGSLAAMHRSKARRVTWATVSLLITACLVFFSVFYWNGQTVSGTQPQRETALSGGDSQKELAFSTSQPSGKEYHQSLPDTLGNVTLKKGMTVWHTLENIYGDSGASVKRQFLEANSQIKDMHMIAEGAMIQMPAIPATANPLRKDTIIISLENSKEMDTLYQSFIQKKELDRMPQVLFLSTWNQKEGKQFLIALDKHCASLEEANEAVRRLPPELAASAQVLSQWDEGTVNFNNRLFRN